MEAKMVDGFRILRQLEEGDSYVPSVGIYVSGSTAKVPMLFIEISLPREATDSDLDQLRAVLKRWADKCKFGELAETGA
jgi:hypothetical protein